MNPRIEHVKENRPVFNENDTATQINILTPDLADSLSPNQDAAYRQLYISQFKIQILKDKEISDIIIKHAIEGTDPDELKSYLEKNQITIGHAGIYIDPALHSLRIRSQYNQDALNALNFLNTHFKNIYDIEDNEQHSNKYYLKFICFCAIEKDENSLTFLPDILDNYLSNKFFPHPITWLARNNDDESVDFLRSIFQISQYDLLHSYLVAERFDRYTSEFDHYLKSHNSTSMYYHVARYGNANILNQILLKYPYVELQEDRSYVMDAVALGLYSAIFFLHVPGYVKYLISGANTNTMHEIIETAKNHYWPDKRDVRLKDTIRAFIHSGYFETKHDVLNMLAPFNPEIRNELINIYITDYPILSKANGITQTLCNKTAELTQENGLTVEQAFLWTSLEKNSYTLLLQVLPGQYWNTLPLELLIHVNSYIFDLDKADTLTLLKSFYAIVPAKLLNESAIHRTPRFFNIAPAPQSDDESLQQKPSSLNYTPG